MAVVEVHEPLCECPPCVRQTALVRHWRVGGQVLRTIYVARPEKHPSQLIGMMDTAELAEHIVQVHNAWVDALIDGEVSP